MQVLKQGAEAKVYKIPFETSSSSFAIAKHRFPKAYRHPSLDEKLTLRRCLQEARTLARLNRTGIDTPALYYVDASNSTLYMEFVEGETVRDVILHGLSQERLEKLGILIGSKLALIHNMDVVHGDLTTSNMILRSTTSESTSADEYSLVWIDFGLSFQSTLHEDKGVDLYVLERAISSTHPKEYQVFFDAILEGYKSCCSQSGAIIKRFEEVRLRGRKRTAFG